DSFIYLHDLLHPELGIALTIDLQYESELRRFTPLVSTSAVHRLMNLTQETITQYLEVQTEPTYTGEAILTTYQLTGGEPFLFQKFYQLANQHPQQSMAIEDIKTIGTEIYRQEMPYFREVWENLQRDERLVLT